MITHVVVFWVNAPVAENAEKLLDGCRKLLTDIPGVQNFRVGAPVPSSRGIVDGSYAVAISMDFTDQAAADAYQAHPQHVGFVNDYFKPLVGRAVVYDFGG
ncbi:MAG: Dabb family protein [Opitutales bacterium]